MEEAARSRAERATRLNDMATDEAVVSEAGEVLDAAASPDGEATGDDSQGALQGGNGDDASQDGDSAEDTAEDGSQAGGEDGGSAEDTAEDGSEAGEDADQDGGSSENTAKDAVKDAAAVAAAAAAARDLVTKRRLTAQLAPHLRPGLAGAERVLMGLPKAWFEDLCGNTMAGGVFLTTYAVVFLPEEQDPMCVALAAIHRVEKKKRTVQDRGYQREIGMLKIYCKDARVVRLFLRQPTALKQRETAVSKDEAMLVDLHTEVTAAVRTISSEPESVFQRAPPDPSTSAELFDTRTEFSRMGALNADSGWRLSVANSDYLLCATYPRDVVVPQTVSDDGLEVVAGFRSQGRFPILCWLHPHSHGESNGVSARAAIVRCSQPCVGVCCNHSPSDQSYMEAVLEANAGSDKVCIMDARPQQNARANRLRNGGFESTSYKSCELEFCDIENVHVMRASLDQLHAYFTSTLTRSYVGTDQVGRTRWLQHVGQLLMATAKIVAEVDKNGRSVVVHCSDGWDRTSQLVSLAQLCLDPFYRTLDGFQVLIEKEWSAAGHKFRDRTWGEEPDQRSPIFFQFLDCTHQLLLQFPDAFEFNEWILIRLTDYLYDNSCNNFLYNSMQEREAAYGHSPVGASCWSLLRTNDSEFKNPYYCATNHGVLAISLQAPLQVWVSYLKRWRARPMDGRIIEAVPEEKKESKLPKSIGERSNYAASKTWPAPDAHWTFRTISFCPCIIMAILVAVVCGLCVFGFLLTGRPATDVSTVGFETRQTLIANQQHTFDLVRGYSWFEDTPAGYSLAQSGAAVPLVIDPPTWHECDSCKRSIEVVAHSNSTTASNLEENDAFNTFTAKRLRSLCMLEQNMISLSSYEKECAQTYDEQGEPRCCAVQSVPRMMLQGNSSSCQTISEDTVQNALSTLCSCSATSPSAQCAPSSIQCANALDGVCGAVGMVACGDICVPVGTQEQRRTAELCGYPRLRSDLLDVGFDGQGARYVRSRICLRSSGVAADPESTDQVTQMILGNLTEWFDEYPEPDSGAYTVYSDELFNAVVTGYLRQDVLRVRFALLLVYIVAVLLSSSMFVPLLGMLHAIFAWPLAYSLYGGILGYEWFPCSSYMSVFLVLCLGMDDMFVFCDMWSSSPACPPAARMTWVWQRIGTPALASTLSTCLTLYANMISFTAPVRLFSIFMVCLVFVRFLLFCAWLPVVMLIRHVTITSCGDKVRGVQGPARIHTDGTRCCCCRTLSLGLRGWQGLLWSCRWPLFVMFGLASIILGLFASHEAERAEPRLALLSDDHMFQQHLQASSQFATDPTSNDMETGVVVHMIWGILPDDERDPYTPADSGAVNFDKAFDLSQTDSQVWLLTLMADIRRQRWVDSELTQPSVIERFDAWLAQHPTSDSGLCHEDLREVDSPKLPLQPAVFRSCFAAFASSAQRRPVGAFWRDGGDLGRPTAIVVSVKTTTRNAEYEALQNLYLDFDSVWQSHARVAGRGHDSGFFISSWFARMDSQQQFFRQQGGTSVLCVFVVILALLYATGSAAISLLGALSVVCSVACSLGIYPLVLQRGQLRLNLRVMEEAASWELGLLETLMIPLLIAQVTEYVIHMGYAYNSATVYATARERSAVALEAVGVPIVASASGTFLLAAVMRQSELEFLHDAALLLMLGSTCSAVCVLVFFLSGLMIFGPERTRRTVWPGGYAMGVMLTAADDLGDAAEGDGSLDWRKAVGSEERERLIWQNLKRTTAALSKLQEENRALKHAVRKLRDGEQHSDSEPENSDRDPHDADGEQEEFKYEPRSGASDARSDASDARSDASDARSDASDARSDSSEADVPAARP